MKRFSRACFCRMTYCRCRNKITSPSLRDKYQMLQESSRKSHACTAKCWKIILFQNIRISWQKLKLLRGITTNQIILFIIFYLLLLFIYFIVKIAQRNVVIIYYYNSYFSHNWLVLVFFLGHKHSFALFINYKPNFC